MRPLNFSTLLKSLIFSAVILLPFSGQAEIDGGEPSFYTCSFSVQSKDVSSNGEFEAPTPCKDKSGCWVVNVDVLVDGEPATYSFSARSEGEAMWINAALEKPRFQSVTLTTLRNPDGALLGLDFWDVYDPSSRNKVNRSFRNVRWYPSGK